MLQKVEREPPPFIQGNDLAVYKRAGRESFTGLGDLWELLCKEVFPPGPECDSARISPGVTAVAVKFNLVEPFLALGETLNQSRIHRLDEADFGGRQRSGLHCLVCQSSVRPLPDAAIICWNFCSICRTAALFGTLGTRSGVLSGKGDAGFSPRVPAFGLA
jgi:hypothetical protein